MKNESKNNMKKNTDINNNYDKLGRLTASVMKYSSMYRKKPLCLE